MSTIYHHNYHPNLHLIISFLLTIIIIIESVDSAESRRINSNRNSIQISRTKRDIYGQSGADPNNPIVYYLCGPFPNTVYSLTRKCFQKYSLKRQEYRKCMFLACLTCRNGGRDLYVGCNNPIQCTPYSRDPSVCIDGRCCTAAPDRNGFHPSDPYSNNQYNPYPNPYNGNNNPYANNNPYYYPYSNNNNNNPYGGNPNVGPYYQYSQQQQQQPGYQYYNQEMDFGELKVSEKTNFKPHTVILLRFAFSLKVFLIFRLLSTR